MAGTTGSERMEQEELLEVGPGAPLRRLVAALVAAAAPPPAGRGLLPALRRLWLGGVTSTAAAGPGGLTGEGAAHGLEEVFDGIEKVSVRFTYVQVCACLLGRVLRCLHVCLLV